MTHVEQEMQKDTALLHQLDSAALNVILPEWMKKDTWGYLMTFFLHHATSSL